MIDFDRYEQTAAWLEYCDGMSRFEAETEAARRQGLKRHEVKNANRIGDTTASGHQRQADARQSKNNMPRVQPAPQKEN
jgi:hypothetical protein